MTVRRSAMVAGVLAAVCCFSLVTARPASADPAKPTNDESKVLSLQPSTDAVSLRVVGGDGFLELHVRRGHEATVEGYGGEPWLRVLRDGTVEENTLSPATYLDANRYARDITIPPDADVKATPKWKTVGHDGHWVWHDHRIHWMNPGVAPPMMPNSDQVRMGDRDDGRWVVPMHVDGKPVAVIGELIRHPAPGAAVPLLVIAALAAAGLAASYLLRGEAARLRGASLVALAAAVAAVFAGYETMRAVPRVAGGSYLVVLIPLGGVLVGLASLALRTATSKCLAVLGAAGCVLGWGLYQLETLWKAVPLSVLPHLAARVVMAAALGAALGAAILAVRSGALAMPSPVVARATEGEAEPGAGPVSPQADSATRP